MLVAVGVLVLKGVEECDGVGVRVDVADGGTGVGEFVAVATTVGVVDGVALVGVEVG